MKDDPELGPGPVLLFTLHFFMIIYWSLYDNAIPLSSRTEKNAES
jgi:hypothetical protein